MSLAGRNAMRGDTYVIYRAVETDAGGGETTRTWNATPIVSASAVFETLSHEIAQKLYGLDTETAVRCKLPLSPAVRLKDGVSVTSGQHSGKRFFVHQAPPRVTHREIVLLLTTESFP